MAFFYDTHAHLDDPDFADDFDQVLDRARDAGVTTIISIAPDSESRGRAGALAAPGPEGFGGGGREGPRAGAIPNNPPIGRGLAMRQRAIALADKHEMI